MKARNRRMAWVAAAMLCLALASWLILNAFGKHLVYFLTPTQVAQGQLPRAGDFRIGGLVLQGSVQRKGVEVQFQVSDTARAIPVHYTGILPDLFREGKGVVAQGRLGRDGVFEAREVLAKHDENYMPPEAAEALRRASAAREKPVTPAAGELAAARSVQDEPSRVQQ